LTCGLCACAVCKSCAEILAPEAFAYADAPEFAAGAFCRGCYDEKVAGPLNDYFETLESAKNVDVFFKKQGKETRLVRRNEKPLSVADCDDEDEAVLRLAFQAALGGFDSLVDVDLKSEKVRDGSYQKLVWRGTGVPAKAKGKVITTDKSIWHNPN
jgi:hypothetical protein